MLPAYCLSIRKHQLQVQRKTSAKLQTNKQTLFNISHRQPASIDAQDCLIALVEFGIELSKTNHCGSVG